MGSGALARHQPKRGDQCEPYAQARRHHLRRVAELVDHQLIGDRLEPRHVFGSRLRRV
jgi:hypothetical protein